MTPNPTPNERATALLARMTLEEKAAQMVGVWQLKAETLVTDDGAFDIEKARRAFGHGHGLGQVGRPSDAGGSGVAGGGHDPMRGRNARQQAELTNAIQKYFIEESRLGIPVVFHEECLHGQAAKDGTSFPQPIGIASSWNPELVEALYAMTAHEARVRGTHQALTPVVDVARDARWGRVEETFGEDPHLVTALGLAAVHGFQGRDSDAGPSPSLPSGSGRHVMATLKHFVAHGQPEAGQNCAPANVSMRELRDVFMPPFEAAVKAGVASVMASYNEVDGVPSHANRWLLRDVLRGEWGFDGFIVSDYYAIWELSDRPGTHGHHVAADKREACALAVKAGVNIELPEPDCYTHLLDLVRDGTLTEADLDDLVRPMLAWKFRMGLFDDPYVDPDEAERVVGQASHVALARRAAEETITLLENDGALPLSLESLGTIAVIGPNADRALLGGYSGVPKHVVTVREGIEAHVAGRAKVVYAEGCKITVGGAWTEDVVTPSDPEEDRRQIAEAVDVAKQADVIVLAIGGNEQTSREAWSRTHMGDRTSLELVGRQQELVDAMAALGKPVIALLFNGRPLALGPVAAKVNALVECWYLGQEGGHAVADMLFGVVNPSGKLPISFPRSAGHVPVFYNHKPSARRGYLWDDATPLYPFGFGRSYTSFTISNVRLERDTMGASDTTHVLCDVTNTGARAGAEVVQVYVRDRVSSVTRPVKELKGFRKVRLAPGETAAVSIPLGPDALSFHGIDMRRVVEPGQFDVMVGTSSRDEDLTTVTLTVHA